MKPSHPIPRVVHHDRLHTIQSQLDNFVECFTALDNAHFTSFILAHLTLQPTFIISLLASLWKIPVLRARWRRVARRGPGVSQDPRIEYQKMAMERSSRINSAPNPDK